MYRFGVPSYPVHMSSVDLYMFWSQLDSFSVVLVGSGLSGEVSGPFGEFSIIFSLSVSIQSSDVSIHSFCGRVSIHLWGCINWNWFRNVQCSFVEACINTYGSMYRYMGKRGRVSRHHRLSIDTWQVVYRLKVGAKGPVSFGCWVYRYTGLRVSIHRAFSRDVSIHEESCIDTWFVSQKFFWGMYRYTSGVYRYIGLFSAEFACSLRVNRSFVPRVYINSP